MKIRKISLSNQILLAVVLGVATGLFFGESCSILEVVGKAFIALMQISVLPYIFVSLIQSFGGLEPSQAKLLALRGLTMVFILWLLVFMLMSAMPLTFPDWQSGSFFSPSMLSAGDEVDYIQLFIPSNPFNALANNVVPAVTIFSILCGVVLMGIPGKRELLSLLDTVSEILTRLTLMLVKLSPIGIFALVAKAAGTMYPEELGRIQVYLLTYCMMGALLFFVVLPLLLTALTPFGYREVLKVGRPAMLTVLLTGNLFIVLPLLVENVKSLFAKHHIGGEESDAMARIIVPVTFIVPCAGQLMDLVFILFSGWFSNVSFGFGQYLSLYGTGFLTLFGSAKVAIPFLLGMFHLPSDLFDIFLISAVVTDNIKFTVEAFAVLSLSTLFTAWMTGHLRLEARRIWLRCGAVVLWCAVGIGALSLVMNHLLPQPRGQKHLLDAMTIRHNVRISVSDCLPEPRPVPPDRVAQIRESRTLRVGFNRNAMPFAFFNSRDELVGFDIAMASKLADELKCENLEFYPVSYDRLSEVLRENRVDIAMSQISVSEERLGTMAFTNHYMTLSMALLVKDHLKSELDETPERILKDNFTVAALEGADFRRLCEWAGPEVRKVEVNSYEEFFSGRVPADSLLISAEKGFAWTILHPEYDVWIPKRQYRDLVAYAVAGDDRRFLDYLNFWLELKAANGDIGNLYNYWIRGINVEKRPPRWSVLHNVLLRPAAAVGFSSSGRQ